MGMLALCDNLRVEEKNLSTTSLSLMSVILPLASCRNNSENKKCELRLCISKKFLIGI